MTKEAITDPFPWLEPNDPHRHLIDGQISERSTDLSEADLSSNDKEKVMEMIFKYRKTFSLCDEMREIPNITIHIEVTDKSSFFV